MSYKSYHICDKCHKEIHEFKQVYNLRREYCDYDERKNWDLCKNCYKLLLKFFDED